MILQRLHHFALLALAIPMSSMLAFQAGGANAAPVYFDVTRGSLPHDVAATPTPGGPVYYTAQRTGKLGILDPATGKFEEIRLGPGSAPHGVIVGPDGAPWITDGGQNAIVRVDPKTRAVRKWPLPQDTGYTNLNTLTFDRKGRVWFTGQSGFYGRLDTATNDVRHITYVGRSPPPPTSSSCTHLAGSGRTESPPRPAATSTMRHSPAITLPASTPTPAKQK